tara:strand:+ start:26853 stop:27287 length:435 start_codon:yes stop_codon:yes gene_type:complete
MNTPMHISEALKLVTRATSSHLHALDEQGYCGESDDYVVALSVFEDWVEQMQKEEEKEAMREGEWNRDPVDHIEEIERDTMLAEDEVNIENQELASAFQEVFRLARTAIQPWWTMEYREKTEQVINKAESYYDQQIRKTLNENN